MGDSRPRLRAPARSRLAVAGVLRCFALWCASAPAASSGREPASSTCCTRGQLPPVLHCPAHCLRLRGGRTSGSGSSGDERESQQKRLTRSTSSLGGSRRRQRESRYNLRDQKRAAPPASFGAPRAAPTAGAPTAGDGVHKHGSKRPDLLGDLRSFGDGAYAEGYLPPVMPILGAVAAGEEPEGDGAQAGVDHAGEAARAIRHLADGHASASASDSASASWAHSRNLPENGSLKRDSTARAHGGEEGEGEGGGMEGGEAAAERERHVAGAGQLDYRRDELEEGEGLALTSSTSCSEDGDSTPLGVGDVGVGVGVGAPVRGKSKRMTTRDGLAATSSGFGWGVGERRVIGRGGWVVGRRAGRWSGKMPLTSLRVRGCRRMMVRWGGGKGRSVR